MRVGFRTSLDYRSENRVHFQLQISFRGNLLFCKKKLCVDKSLCLKFGRDFKAPRVPVLRARRDCTCQGRPALPSPCGLVQGPGPGHSPHLPTTAAAGPGGPGPPQLGKLPPPVTSSRAQVARSII